VGAGAASLLPFNVLPVPKKMDNDSCLRTERGTAASNQLPLPRPLKVLPRARYRRLDTGFAPHKKVFEKPGVRLAVGAAALLPFVLFLLSNFFQLRGFVDLTASRIDLGVAVILLLGLVYVFAFNLPSRRLPTAAIGCVLVLVAAFGLDRLTLSPKVAPPAPPVVVNHSQPVQSLAPNELAAPTAKPTKRSAEKPTEKPVRRLTDLPEKEQLQALHQINDLLARYALENGGAPAPREWVRNKLKKASGVDIGPTPSSVDAHLEQVCW
jgi:hypothetical protein